MSTSPSFSSSTSSSKIQTLHNTINFLYYLASIFWVISVLIYVYKYNKGEWTSVEVLSILAALSWFFAMVLQSIKERLEFHVLRENEREGGKDGMMMGREKDEHLQLAIEDGLWVNNIWASCFGEDLPFENEVLDCLAVRGIGDGDVFVSPIWQEHNRCLIGGLSPY